MRYVVAATLALSAAVLAQSPPQEFEVAVIKRNISADSSSGGRFGANGQEDLINVSARTLIVALARSMQLQTERLVVDKTGLEGEFDAERRS